MSNRLVAKFYEPWLGEILPSGFQESIATCDSCVMVKPTGCGRARRDPGPFLDDLKCCTHFPYLANFTIGGILKNGTREQVDVLREAIEKGNLSPLGLFPTAEYRALREDLGESAFGRDQRLLCPFFSRANSGCTIWKFRPGVCSSYFCESVAGEEGFRFWREVESFLHLFEWTLAHDVLWQLGLTQDEVNSRQWFEYIERKDELFLKAYEISLQVTPEYVRELMGLEGSSLLENIQKIQAQLRLKI